MCHCHRVSLRNKEKRRCEQGVGQKGVGKHLEVRLPWGSHEIGGLGTCMLLMNYLTQTSLMMTISKL